MGGDYLTPDDVADAPDEDLFDVSLWTDAATEDPEALKTFGEEIESDDDRFGTTERDLWSRPDLVGLEEWT